MESGRLKKEQGAFPVIFRLIAVRNIVATLFPRLVKLSQSNVPFFPEYLQLHYCDVHSTRVVRQSPGTTVVDGTRKQPKSTRLSCCGHCAVPQTPRHHKRGLCQGSKRSPHQATERRLRALQATITRSGPALEILKA